MLAYTTFEQTYSRVEIWFKLLVRHFAVLLVILLLLIV